MIVDREDLLIYRLNGLPSEFNAFLTSMRTRSQSVMFNELHVLVESEEVASEKQNQCKDLHLQPTTLLTSIFQ